MSLKIGNLTISRLDDRNWTLEQSGKSVLYFPSLHHALLRAHGMRLQGKDLKDVQTLIKAIEKAYEDIKRVIEAAEIQDNGQDAADRT